VAVRASDTGRLGFQTLSDAARHSPGWKIGAGYEFQQRPDGYDGLIKTYRLPLAGAPKWMDLALVYKAIEQQQVDMIVANATDGMLAVMDLKVLRDDQHYFPPYEAAVLVRTPALQEHPGLREALTALSGKFTDQVMQKLNHQVDGEKKSVAEVAARFLREAGLQ
jgi:glycine betaine/choline ABC-type transport system substrate-binding protein